MLIWCLCGPLRPFYGVEAQMDRALDSQGEVLLEVAAVPQKPRPQLHANDPENEEDEEAEEQHVAEHGQSVQQEVHQDTQTCAREADG